MQGRLRRSNRSMTDSDDSVVRQILAEIGKHGGASGVTFHQRPTAAARYPTDAILTAVRLLAEEAEDAGSPMAAGLRAMLEQVDPNLPIEIEFSGAGPLDCITERTDEHGYWWRYQHSADEAHDTLTAAIRVAADVAAEEARRSGKPYVVASSLRPPSMCSPVIIPIVPGPRSASCLNSPRPVSASAVPAPAPPPGIDHEPRSSRRMVVVRRQ
jgi:hypothetical protein